MKYTILCLPFIFVPNSYQLYLPKVIEKIGLYNLIWREGTTSVLGTVYFFFRLPNLQMTSQPSRQPSYPQILLRCCSRLSIGSPVISLAQPLLKNPNPRKS
uniref:Uncharacterized protein n=1 Tax=Rhizophagus irregularis (strain DAOM 181602 / DAOM 197198 / MUCL 43194) TaxID=747089 RepID=U9T6W5_RHIID